MVGAGGLCDLFPRSCLTNDNPSTTDAFIGYFVPGSAARLLSSRRFHWEI